MEELLLCGLRQLSAKPGAGNHAAEHPWGGLERYLKNTNLSKISVLGRPPAGFSGSDYGSSSGLSWTFGLKQQKSHGV